MRKGCKKIGEVENKEILVCEKSDENVDFSKITNGNWDGKEFAKLIQKYEKELTKDLNLQELINVNLLDRNKEAIKLAEKEVKEYLLKKGKSLK